SGAVEMDDATEDEGEETWTAAGGAVFLANIDDDEEACEINGLTDVQLEECNDAADETVNGEADIKDLAPIRIAAWPDAPDGATATLTISNTEMVRVFHHVQPNNPIAWVLWDSATSALDAAQLREGAELALEGLDIIRDLAVWDGYVELTLTVSDGTEVVGTDVVRMRMSPMMTYHHMLPAETLYASRFNYQSSVDFRGDIQAAMDATGMEGELFNIDYPDQWAQDFFETAYMSMPSADPDAKNGQHAIRVNLRSANVDSPNLVENPLRFAGRVVFEVLRGPDSAGVQEYTLERTQAENQMDSLNSFGNTETVPPYSKDGVDYPLGRLFRGSIESFYPDKAFSQMMEAQGQQPPVYVDTSWLLVGHVDETISFIRADNDKGWTIAANDAAMAVDLFEKLVEDGQGDAPMFVGKFWDTDEPSETTPTEILANKVVMEESAKAIAEVDAQLQILYDETGLTGDDVMWVPFLHEASYGFSVAHQPGTVNGISISPTSFAPPKPHGPIVDGKDVFEEQMKTAWAEQGIMVNFVEDWDLYHVLLGEVHCGSNATRAIPEAKWWETGR
ncbi:MAG: protein-arginine deiminase, partial [Myxococcota bacterium]